PDHVGVRGQLGGHFLTDVGLLLVVLRVDHDLEVLDGALLVGLIGGQLGAVDDAGGQRGQVGGRRSDDADLHRIGGVGAGGGGSACLPCFRGGRCRRLLAASCSQQGQDG